MIVAGVAHAATVVIGTGIEIETVIVTETETETGIANVIRTETGSVTAVTENGREIEKGIVTRIASEKETATGTGIGTETEIGIATVIETDVAADGIAASRLDGSGAIGVTGTEGAEAGVVARTTIMCC